MKKALAILIVIILALIAGFAGGVYYSSNFSNHYSQKDIEEQVLEIAELATLQCNYTEESDFEGDAKQVFGHDIPFTKKSMKMQYSGIVKMGPVLKDHMKVDLDSSGNTVNITIPHSEILSHEIDENSIKIVYIKNGVFNSVTPADSNQLRKDAKKAKEKSIKKSDYFDQADKNAIDQITTFLKTVYPDLDVTVKVR